MQNINWQKIVVILSLVVTFVIAGLQAIGTSVPASADIIAILSVIAGLLHGPSVNKAVAMANLDSVK